VDAQLATFGIDHPVFDDADAGVFVALLDEVAAAATLAEDFDDGCGNSLGPRLVVQRLGGQVDRMIGIAVADHAR
jgi:hypothetical protein